MSRLVRGLNHRAHTLSVRFPLMASRLALCAAALVAAGVAVSCSQEGGVAPGGPTVASITVTPPSPTMVLGDTGQFKATVFDQDGNELVGRAVEWSTTDPSPDSISADGVFGPKHLGSATIIATVDGIVGRATVGVGLGFASSISITPSSPTLPVGASQQFAATIRDQNGNIIPDLPITWSSSATAIASVDPAGMVHAN